jgi:hypothetical protein
MARGGDLTNWAGSASVAGVLLGLVLVLSGCGGDDEGRASKLRPPSPIQISVVIGENSVSASPRKFGAGPISLLTSNQSRASHTLTISGPRLEQSVGPINPQDTALLRVTVQPGQYSLSADDSAVVRSARLTVGPKRPSAQNQLLQP